MPEAKVFARERTKIVVCSLLFVIGITNFPQHVFAAAKAVQPVKGGVEFFV
jgi:hypothetical protein